MRSKPSPKGRFWGVGDSRIARDPRPSKNLPKCIIPNFDRKEHTMEILKNLENLVKVKTLVTMAVMTVFCALALRGAITADNVMIVVSTVIAFYFGTQQAK